MKLFTAIALLHITNLPFSHSFSPNSQRLTWAEAKSHYSSTTSNAHSCSTSTLPTSRLYMSAEDKTEPKIPLENFSESDQNRTYIEGLLQNLSAALDRWIVTGSNGTKERAFNIMRQIKRESMDDELLKQAIRMSERASMPMGEFKTEMEMDGDSAKRKSEAEERKEWETQRSASEGKRFPGNIAGSKPTGRSALSNRATKNGKPDLFMPNVDKNVDPKRLEDFASSKKGLEDALSENIKGSGSELTPAETPVNDDEMAIAEAKSSEIIAKAGAGSAFEGGSLGIGGLDDVLAQVKRRIWVPLAAPPSLLKELGINPVRGLLLYGLPGCGKTLLARSLGKILSPARPITVVSGPEIMDKFVGSSEANLRAIFDNPPEISDIFRIGTKDNGAALEKVALHVIVRIIFSLSPICFSIFRLLTQPSPILQVLDEFDAMARARGGRGGDQGDAGVARDSVVNQLLAKMDGVDPLCVPTLVIGMTNRRTLIEPALLRPGRFEVQIEVPKPRTVEQRISILSVHMNNMFKAGRLFVRDAPEGTAAWKRMQKQKDEYKKHILSSNPDTGTIPAGFTHNGESTVLTYDELLDNIAVKCDGMSGASLAGVARAAASRALERAVCDFAGHFDTEADSPQEGYSIADCLVTMADFDNAIEDVVESSRGGDGGEEDEEEALDDGGKEDAEKEDADDDDSS